MSCRVIDTVSRRITGPTVPVLDLDEAKKYIRFTSTSEDTLIDSMLEAATEYFESETGIICLNQTWEYGLSGTPMETEIELPKAPLQSIVSIVSGEDEEMDAESYEAVQASVGATSRGRVRRLSGSWPTVIEPTSGGIRIQYVAGFGAQPGSVPKMIVHAIGMIFAKFHQFRASVHVHSGGTIVSVPMGVNEIIRNYKYANVPTLAPRGVCWP